VCQSNLEMSGKKENEKNRGKFFQFLITNHITTITSLLTIVSKEVIVVFQSISDNK